jgi:hypothetical protein
MDIWKDFPYSLAEIDKDPVQVTEDVIGALLFLLSLCEVGEGR